MNDWEKQANDLLAQYCGYSSRENYKEFMEFIRTQISQAHESGRQQGIKEGLNMLSREAYQAGINDCKKPHCKCMQLTPCGNHHYSDCGWIFDRLKKPSNPQTLTARLDRQEEAIRYLARNLDDKTLYVGVKAKNFSENMVNSILKGE